MSFTKELKIICKKEWDYGLNHIFLKELGLGTLELQKFQNYLIQDYYYLLEFAKIFAILAKKSSDEYLLEKFTRLQFDTLFIELSIHKDYMKKFSISKKVFNNTKVSIWNKAYTQNMFYIAENNTVLEGLVTILPCAWTYYEYASELKEKYANNLKGNRYESFINMYSSLEFYNSFLWIFEEIDNRANSINITRKENLIKIFKESIIFENKFWDMAYE